MTEIAMAGGVVYAWQADRPVSDPGLLTDLTAGWATRAEAEAWLAGIYPDLLDEGVGEVTLLADGLPVYTMSLQP